MYTSNEVVDTVMVAVLAGIFLGLAILAVVWFIFYILGSIGLMKIAKKHGEQYAWIAWIPIARSYLKAKIAFNTTIAWVLVALQAVLWIIIPMAFNSLMMLEEVGGVSPIVREAEMLQMLSILGSFSMSMLWTSFVASAISLMYFVADYKLYEKMSKKAIPMLFVSAVTAGVLNPVFIFAIRNNELIGKEATDENDTTIDEEDHTEHGEISEVEVVDVEVSQEQ